MTLFNEIEYHNQNSVVSNEKTQHMIRSKRNASVVQWISHSPCKPGVAGSIPGFSKNNYKTNLPVEPSGAPGTTKPTKTTSYSTGLAQEKNKKCCMGGSRGGGDMRSGHPPPPGIARLLVFAMLKFSARPLLGIWTPPEKIFWNRAWADFNFHS